MKCIRAVVTVISCDVKEVMNETAGTNEVWSLPLGLQRPGGRVSVVRSVGCLPHGRRTETVQDWTTTRKPNNVERSYRWRRS